MPHYPRQQCWKSIINLRETRDFVWQFEMVKEITGVIKATKADVIFSLEMACLWKGNGIFKIHSRDPLFSSLSSMVLVIIILHKSKELNYVKDITFGQGRDHGYE